MPGPQVTSRLEYYTHRHSPLRNNKESTAEQTISQPPREQTGSSKQQACNSGQTRSGNTVGCSLHAVPKLVVDQDLSEGCCTGVHPCELAHKAVARWTWVDEVGMQQQGKAGLGTLVHGAVNQNGWV
eukprot:NODE_1918_length_1182_cov_44.796209_g1902_i0.p1 GENE.NODE_1918_length_1182_cov_44.796209_g1902_i0~~NODE_1918_length_1182_cov_44.796209_g1902_i0.p1  ORF type:complete len:127 (-),score=9.06 NODE_1918_length_1182_cov_44.796209_g1902_i0:101-481(-)